MRFFIADYIDNLANVNLHHIGRFCLCGRDMLFCVKHYGVFVVRSRDAFVVVVVVVVA